MRQFYSAAELVWTAERLRERLAESRRHTDVLVLANHEPVRHEHEPDGCLSWKHSSRGFVAAVEPLVRACSGTWVAHGGGTADRLSVDERDGLGVPPDDPAYRLRRVWLSSDDIRGYYYGFAKGALWPLCHLAHQRPDFRSEDFQTYATVNRRFVDALCEEATSADPLVLVQGHHFALAPRIARERLPFSTIVTYWHIPWPSWQQFAICPWHDQLLVSLLASDIVGFQTPDDCRNFMETVAQAPFDAEIDADQDAIAYAGRRVMVRAYPTSVEWPNRWIPGLPDIETCRRLIRRRLEVPAEMLLGVGVDDLDYTAGLEEKYLAVERMLECYPELAESFTFVQLVEPSDDRPQSCLDLRWRVLATVYRINARFGRAGRRPAILLEAHHEPAEICRFFRAADLCYVASLHDGMNLVGKEFVSARDDECGALVLSSFAGAAKELTDALIVNPYDLDRAADALARALTMDDDERRNRMRQMRSVVAEFSAYRWARVLLTDAGTIRDEIRSS